MLDKGTSEISWQVDGSLGGQPVSLLFTTTCEHNLVTGRITNHRCGQGAAGPAGPRAGVGGSRAAVGVARQLWCGGSGGGRGHRAQGGTAGT